MHSTGFHLSLSLFTLLVPGRQLIIDGMKSLIRGTPNMNTLVGLGAISSFTVSSFAALIPKLVNTTDLLYNIFLLPANTQFSPNRAFDLIVQNYKIALLVFGIFFSVLMNTKLNKHLYRFLVSFLAQEMFW